MPEPTRDDTHDKRQAILAAARDLFAGQGFEETTIAEIARAADVAVGTVYLYFQSKHDILIDVCLALNAEIAKVIQSPKILALPLLQVPRAIIEATFRTSRENLGLYVLLPSGGAIACGGVTSSRLQTGGSLILWMPFSSTSSPKGRWRHLMPLRMPSCSTIW